MSTGLAIRWINGIRNDEKMSEAPGQRFEKMDVLGAIEDVGHLFLVAGNG
jgi:hypothetical protein